jgi:ribulose-phosphate 3-epimerase
MKNNILINPSILNAKFDDLANEIAKVSLSADQLHLDIMDNIFVPNFTFDFQRAKEIIAFSDLPVDAHLMIADPDNSAPKYAQAGCVSVTFHLEAAKNIGQTISDVKSNGAKVGVAVKPGTPFSLVEPFIEQIDLLLIMTVEPGFGGQSFMHEQMDKVKTARSRIELIKGGKPLIQVDGGISLETIGEAASAGANCFVAGSAVYKSADPENMVQLLRKSAEEHFKY